MYEKCFSISISNLSSRIIYPFPNLNGCTTEVPEKKNNFIPCFRMGVKNNPCVQIRKLLIYTFTFLLSLIHKYIRYYWSHIYYILTLSDTQIYQILLESYIFVFTNDLHITFHFTISSLDKILMFQTLK